jgi:hypothetical protein
VMCGPFVFLIALNLQVNHIRSGVLNDHLIGAFQGCKGV